MSRLGIGSVKSTVSGFGSQTETGVGMILGLGYDMRVSPNASITPCWNGFAMRNDVIDANVGQLGLAVTLHQEVAVAKKGPVLSTDPFS